ncbi:hypothetical protein AB0D08_04020 [Kitasatospora sp. NPDC048540]|uniref:hypothetical protein n=1 Tax=unclassified Kitasatospora TaxID=2633591 RepID=UPI00068F9EEA|nr:hypothetical protein [Kitasatospora sp. MBT63]
MRAIRPLRNLTRITRIVPRLALAFVAAAALLLADLAVAPTQAGAAGLDNTWACSVPAGYTYDQVQQTRQCSGGSSWTSTVFHLRTPADGVMSCTPVDGFVYDYVSLGSACAQIGPQAASYRLRTAVDGMMACTVKPGWTYDLISYGSACSQNAGVPSTTYRIKQPVNGLWACFAPSGWTTTASMSTFDCSYTSGVPSTKYRLAG